MRGWVRVNECLNCGESRCVQNTRNSRMFFCFRVNKTFFSRKDGSISLNVVSKNENKLQKEFDFMKNN